MHQLILVVELLPLAGVGQSIRLMLAKHLKTSRSRLLSQRSNITQLCNKIDI